MKTCRSGRHPWVEGQTQCRECRRVWFKANQAREQARRVVDKTARRMRQIARYGLDPSTGCDICGTLDWGGRHGVPNIDHDHSCCPYRKLCTKCVRGLLCDRCNKGLGNFGDSPERLRAAADYLERTAIGNRQPVLESI